MTENPIHGSCLCGAVHYEALPPFVTFQYCHCSRCRKTTGSAHASNLFVPPAQFRWTKGEDNVGRYELPEAKHYATCFCKTCGSSLPWPNKSGTMVMVTAGTLDDDPGVHPARNVHWASRASWYLHAKDLDTFDTVPPRKA